MATKHRLQAKRLHYSGKKMGKIETVVFALKARWICALSNSPLGLKKKRGRKVRSIFELQIGQSNKSTALTMNIKTYPSFSIHFQQSIDRGNKNWAQFYKLIQ
jgi:hypothetical protein